MTRVQQGPASEPASGSKKTPRHEPTMLPPCCSVCSLALARSEGRNNCNTCGQELLCGKCWRLRRCCRTVDETLDLETLALVQQASPKVVPDLMPTPFTDPDFDPDSESQKAMGLAAKIEPKPTPPISMRPARLGIQVCFVDCCINDPRGLSEERTTEVADHHGGAEDSLRELRDRFDYTPEVRPCSYDEPTKCQACDGDISPLKPNAHCRECGTGPIHPCCLYLHRCADRRIESQRSWD